MKKALIISGFIAICALGGTLYLLFTGETKTTSPTTVSDGATTTPAQEESVRGQGTLTALLGLNRPLECSIIYKSSTEGESVTGTYFTARGMLRGDFVVPEMATGSVSSLIVRDNTLYTWSVIDNEAYGMKVDLATLEAVKHSETAPNTNEPVPLDATISYDCVPWTNIDTSVFTAPSEVLFTNYADIMNKGMEFSTIYEEAPTTDTSTQCELCRKVKGEAQKACLTQFACQ